MSSLLKPLPTNFIQFGSKAIHYSLLRSARKTLAISVYPDLKVVATAPLDASLEAIQNKIRKRASWIIQQQVYFSEYLPAKQPRQFVSGASIYYLGKQYRLKVRKKEKIKIAFEGKFLCVDFSKPQNQSEVSKLLTAWLHERARRYFQLKIDYWWPKLSKSNCLPPKLIVKPMKKRWGSFTQSKQIILNDELVEAPSQCINYVVVHELCHAFHPNHSRAFFRLLRKIMPDWEKRKICLERLGI